MKQKYSPNLFAEAGSNRSVEDRERLAQAIDGFVESLRSPTESREQFKALGIPLTPRVMGSLAIAATSAVATAMFRLVTG